MVVYARTRAKAFFTTGRDVLLLPGDVTQAEHYRHIVTQGVGRFAKIDVVVNNAADQMTRGSLDEISDDELDYTMKTNIYAMFHICKAAVPHMPPDGSIINNASVNADRPKAMLLAYSATKAAIVNFSGGLAALLANKGIRSNAAYSGNDAA